MGSRGPRTRSQARDRPDPLTEQAVLPDEESPLSILEDNTTLQLVGNDTVTELERVRNEVRQL